MNSRKRFHVDVDRLSRIEEDLERLSLYDDQAIQNSQLQQMQDKYFESLPAEQHTSHQEVLHNKHFKQPQQELQHCLQPFNHENHYCKLDHSNGDVNLFGNHYQYLTDFRSGRLLSLDGTPCSHQILNDHKNSAEMSEDCTVSSEGMKFLKEKYDSLGKVKVMKPQSAVGDSAAASQVHQEHEKSKKQFQDHIENKICQQHHVMHFNEPQQRESLQDLHFFPEPQQTAGAFAMQEGMQRFDEQWGHHPNNFQMKDEQTNISNPSNQTTHNVSKLQEPEERRLLGDHDLMQVDIFYRSQRSEIFVSRCCANLMLGPKWSFQSTGSLGGSPASGVRQLCRNFRDWACVKSGIPVLVLDTSKNELSLILAEHGSGFAIWRNRMGPLTGYSVIAANFHALRTDPSMQRSLANPPSTLITSIVGLNFIHIGAAEEFYKNVVNLSTLASSPGAPLAANRNRHVSGDHLKDPQRIEKSLSNSTQDLQASGLQTNKQVGERIKSAKKSKKLSSKSFSKTDISQPCCFTHVTKLGDRFRDGSSRLFLTSSDTNVLLRGGGTIDKKSALHRLQGGLKQKH